MLQRLMNDHKHIAILLKLLKGKYQKLAEGEHVNFNLVRDVVEYMQGYAEHSHHPLEDIIYDYFLIKESRTEPTRRLEQEHQKLIDASSTLMATLNLILNDVVVAKEKLVTELKEYVDLQEKHMLYEEREIFPLLAKSLQDEDWQKIQSMCELKLIEDPLFSSDDNQLFDELRNYIHTADR
ncbi:MULTISPECIES: hemerythrin domain-containing protein [Shewanella]|uniref:Hemerythrin n=2 Tax=Shewanella TaxID=22 RepID=A0A6G7LUR1_9GAMM|nr:MULTISPECIES: hemerythrin domain-containing protein [Shewanella]OIN08580.1 hemerythrin [Shewanella algae]MBZ4678827.1 hemerythrin [Shewanella sp.]MCA0949382.1 hemerythrin domain-containing protein [Shewanella chilikensis]MCE9788952.1 hemerythrin domain-containing protein [Shewanella chilikensis]MCE9791585.1 hemerythrin domain-containing protein [Shewanella indica]